MITQNNVPYSLVEVTPEWLTEVMREAGLLDEESVIQAKQNKLSEGVGFNGELARLELEYSSNATSAPSTMVVKIPTTSKNRILGQTMGLYEKEIRFYRDLSNKLEINTPQHYCSALDIADDPDEILERLEGLNKLPMWLIGVLSKAATWFVGKTPRRYVLLIEDLSAHRMGDQNTGCNRQDTEQIIELMAKLHAQFWDDNELKSTSWIAPTSSTSKVLHSMFLPARRNIRNSDLGENQRELAEWLTENGVQISDTLGGETPTLLHGDVRLDNICFDDELHSLTLMDWQTMQAGPPGMELAYFVSATLPASSAEQEVNELISLYHQKFTEAGGVITLDRLKWQYQLAMLAMLHRILPQKYSGQTDTGERGPEFFEDWLGKIFSRLSPVDYRNIFNEIPD